MSGENTGSAFSFGNNKPTGTNDKQQDQINSPVEEEIKSASLDEDNANLDGSYTDRRSVTVSLVRNYSLYRRANDKVLPKKKDSIGSCITSSKTLASNKEEVETIFPNIIGLSVNDKDFVSRVKSYLNNIKVDVDELGKTLDTSFIYNTKADYLNFKAKEEAIENRFLKADRQQLGKLKEALKVKLTELNVLESSKHKVGYAVNVDDYIIYRHCLLYDDVAKDISLINSDPSIRFYFKDNQREREKEVKFRAQLNKAKTNYVSTLADPVLFESIYTQYLALNSYPIIAGLAEDLFDKETKLDKFSMEQPVKFNNMFNNKDVKLVGTIELLIAHGELRRAEHNQNISDNEGNFIGANMGEVVAWFKSPDNTSTVNAYYNKLKNI